MEENYVDGIVKGIIAEIKIISPEEIKNLEIMMKEDWFKTLKLAKSSDFWTEIGKKDKVTDETIKDFVAKKWLKFEKVSAWVKAKQDSLRAEDNWALVCAKIAEKIQDSKKAKEVKDAAFKYFEEIDLYFEEFEEIDLLPGTLKTTITPLVCEKKTYEGKKYIFVKPKGGNDGWWLTLTGVGKQYNRPFKLKNEPFKLNFSGKVLFHVGENRLLWAETKGVFYRVILKSTAAGNVDEKNPDQAYLQLSQNDHQARAEEVSFG